MATSKEIEKQLIKLKKLEKDEDFVDMLKNYLVDIGSNLTIKNIKRSDKFLRELIRKLGK